MAGQHFWQCESTGMQCSRLCIHCLPSTHCWDAKGNPAGLHGSLKAHRLTFVCVIYTQHCTHVRRVEGIETTGPAVLSAEAFSHACYMLEPHQGGDIGVSPKGGDTGGGFLSLQGIPKVSHWGGGSGCHQHLFLQEGSCSLLRKFVYA